MRILKIFTIIFGLTFLTACSDNKFEGTWSLTNDFYEQGNYILISGKNATLVESGEAILDCILETPTKSKTKLSCPEAPDKTADPSVERVGDKLKFTDGRNGDSYFLIKIL